MQIVLLVVAGWLVLDAVLLSGWVLSFRVARRHAAARPDVDPLYPALPSSAGRRHHLLRTH